MPALVAGVELHPEGYNPVVEVICAKFEVELAPGDAQRYLMMSKGLSMSVTCEVLFYKEI